MGRKSQSKQSSKKNPGKENNRIIQKRKDLSILVDKVLRLTSIFQAACNLTKSWEHHLEIYEILKKISNVETAYSPKNKHIPRRANIEKYLKWLSDNEAQYEGVEICEFEGYELGLKAITEFKEDSLILTVPTKVMMTEKNAQESELADFIKVDPLLKNMPNITLALFLLLEKNNPAKNTLEESLLTLLTKWRAGDRGPFSFPLPNLEEIKIPAVSGNYEGYGAKISYETSQLKLVGLKDFSVAALDASEANLKASGTITIPSLTLSSDKYTIKGRALWFIPANGSGKMSINFGRSQLTFSLRLQSNSSSTWVDSLQMAFSVGSIKANLDSGPAAINTILNNSGVSIIKSNHDAIVNMVRNLVLPVINNFLAGMTPDQLFQTIAGNKTLTPNVVRV